jgi:hypothetical protein
MKSNAAGIGGHRNKEGFYLVDRFISCSISIKLLLQIYFISDDFSA